MPTANAELKPSRSRGRVGGRKPRLTPSQERAVLSVVDGKKQSLTKIVDDFSSSRSTLYRILERHRYKSGPDPPVSGPGSD